MNFYLKVRGGRYYIIIYNIKMPTTTPDMKPKLSYSQRMLKHLEDNKVAEETLDLIREFSRQESIIIQAEREASRGLMTFGKYVGKQLEEIHKLDPKYVDWLSKNNKYLNSENKEVVAKLVAK